MFDKLFNILGLLKIFILIVKKDIGDWERIFGALITHLLLIQLESLNR
jgi:hypothetical protein